MVSRKTSKNPKVTCQQTGAKGGNTPETAGGGTLRKDQHGLDTGLPDEAGNGGCHHNGALG